MYREYVEKRFNRSSQLVIQQANAIIEQYQAEGYVLTLRQLYYRFVAQAWLANTTQNYKRLGSIVNDARLAGEIDWEAIEDRTRELHELAAWRSPTQIIDAVAEQYREELWRDQPTRVEVWIEKEALEGVFTRICDQLHVPLFACRGYPSQSSVWEASQRFERYTDGGQDVVILHFGDHDPSGIDMTRDIDDRLNETFGVQVEVQRIALNMDQVRQYDPPPNPAKASDSRHDAYFARFGNSSWELDALEPTVLAALVRDNVALHRDDERWEEDMRQQEMNRRRLLAVSENWSKVLEALKDEIAELDSMEDPEAHRG